MWEAFSSNREGDNGTLEEALGETGNSSANCSQNIPITQAIEFYWPISPHTYFGVCTVISHVLVTGITIGISRKCFEMKLAKTAEHAFYCTLAFVFCITEALLLRNSLILKKLLSRLGQDMLHSALGLLAFAIGIVGVGVKTWQKRKVLRENEKASVRHFHSMHARFGLFGCIFLLLTTISGLTLYFWPGRMLNIGHRTVALLSFLLLMISQMYSYNTGFARRNWTEKTVRRYKLATFIVIITSINFELRHWVVDVVALIPKEFFDKILLKT
ncbi:cytochrome b561 domain-containing protein 2 isoform X2 [Scaptodrosophila lebanonensis]|nr:cytochrome b561 domain-containing protein 2 isoform X2 [Scaptodrosophila lebanonensis]